MKTNMFTVVVLLTILLSASSSFISPSTHFAPNKWERFGIQNCSFAYNDRILDTFHLVQTSSMTDTDAEISSFNLENLGGLQVTCAANVTCVCAAIVSYRGNATTELSLVDYTYGIYSIE